VRVGVVAAIGDERLRSSQCSRAFATQRRDRLHEREQLGDVVAVGAGEKAGERDAARVGDQVMFGAGFAPVNRARPGLGAPKSARSEAESQTARERSSRPAWRSRASSSSCSCCQTPACCQSRRPAGHARAEAEFSRESLPGDPGREHEQDPVQHLAVVDPSAARMALTPRPWWQEWLDEFTEFVIDQGWWHQGPPFLFPVSAHLSGLGS
jgi:hypothetical protein